MKIPAVLAALLALGLGCGGGAAPRPAPEAKPAPAAEPKPPRPEPQHILVAHVLIAFQGAKSAKATRTREAAEKLAQDVLARARKGEDFNKLIRDLSDDEGEGVYGLANAHVSPVGNEFGRRDMVPAFGDVGFTLEVGEVGVAPYDPDKSPYGWHVIKRLK